MKTVIIFIGICLFVTAILVYQVTNPVMKETIYTSRPEATHAINSYNKGSDLTISTGFKSNIRFSSSPVINKDF